MEQQLQKQQTLIARLQEQLAESRQQPEPTTDTIEEIRKVKLPIFWQKDPVLWFAQVDAQLHTYKIRSDITRFFTVVAALDCNVLQQVSDVVANLPSTDKYETIKKKLIAAYSDSQDHQLRKLLNEIELGDHKPSQLLRQMRSLADKRINEDVLKTLWVQRLPQNVQLILSASEGVTLDKMADVADKLVEIYASGSISAVNRAASPRRTNMSESASALLVMQKQIEMLTDMVKTLTTDRGRSQQRYGRSKSRSRTHSGNSRHRPAEEVCYYHASFGEKARKCKPPCNFKPKEN
ncbi:uncharacterized protein LOC116166447 [Photinus pyralis]|uniref:uncharacterized protein LOC116166447 n=1 Tax=Photinus pyralis TaxID=7054 RepID=UPI0012673961|nr:uncharacterized protein LOC116166447 [Photinus pyralis]